MAAVLASCLAICLAFSLACAPLAWAGATITAIQVVGNQRIDAATVRYHLGMTPGDHFEHAKANAALKAMFATGLFADATIEEKAGRVVVHVTENPVVGKVSFTGSKAIEEKTVKEAAKLAPKEPYTRARGEAAVHRIRELYRGKGYEDVAVEVKTEATHENRLDVDFTIRENAIVKVESIIFTGNVAYTAGQLREVISTREAAWWDFLRGPTPPDEARLDLDRAMLIEHYQKHGFADVRVAEGKAERNPETKAWRVTFAIDEGTRYTVGAIGVRSQIPDVATAPLQAEITLRSGDAWAPDRVEKAIEHMTMSLVAAGHPEAQVHVVPDRDPSGRTMGVQFQVKLGPRIVIERIEITGDKWTRQEVIRRELKFFEGDIYQPVMLAQAKTRIMGLGLFKSVDLKPVPGSDKAHVAITIAVVEQDSREIGFGIGYSSSEGVVGDITLTENNLFGGGERLSLKVSGSQKSASGSLGYTQPHFLDTSVAAGFDLFYKDTDLTTQSSYKTTRYGGDIRFATEVAPNTTSTVSYTLSRNTLYDVGPNASLAIRQALAPGATTASYDTSSIGYGVAYDTRDKKTNPMSGVLISTTQDLAGLGGDVRYLRTTAEIRGYMPITDTVTLAGRASGGTIMGWGASQVPLLDQFYHGGDIVRGFSTSGIGPRDTSSLNQDALGGTNYLATTAELRFPVPFAPDNIGLRGAVFTDAGTLFGTNAATKSVAGVVGTTAALRASAGVGLIWDSPLGPLRADYAIPLVKQPFDKTQNLQFGLMPGF